MGAMLTISTASIAQTPVGQGSIIIDPYIGVPNWNNSLLYNNIEDNTSDSTAADYHVNGGQLSYGGRVEYLVADNFGIGIDFNYEVAGFGFDYMDYNPVTSAYDLPMNYEYKAKRSRIMARLNYHFVQNDRVDAYAGFAGGYKIVNRSGVTTNETTKVQTADTDFPDALIPVAIRLAIGARFYFTDNIGAHVELGALGGGLLQVGISAKF